MLSELKLNDKIILGPPHLAPSVTLQAIKPILICGGCDCLISFSTMKLSRRLGISKTLLKVNSNPVDHPFVKLFIIGVALNTNELSAAIPCLLVPLVYVVEPTCSFCASQCFSVYVQAVYQLLTSTN